MHRFRISLICAGLTLAWVLLMYTSTASGEGESPADAFAGIWHLKLVPDSDTKRDGAKEFDEAIMFEDGQLMAENFACYGFTPGEYTIPEDQPSKFSAAMESNSKGKLDWSGVVQINKLTGQLIWTKKDGKVWKFTYTGRK
ncbi:MAG: hypothetical protein ACM359_11320 [Bacillota bacterium]